MHNNRPAFEVLISTTDLKGSHSLPPGLEDLVNQQIACLIVNQSEQIPGDLDLKNAQVRLVSYKETGMSKSRNRALVMSRGDIILLADDDLRFTGNLTAIILDAFASCPKADIICFQMQKEDGTPYKKYGKTPYWINHRTAMKVSSVEIAMRRSAIVNKGVQFDEDFGLNAPFPTGSETVFLANALKKGLRIRYVPVPIVIHPGLSSGYRLHKNPSLVRAKGAMLYRIFGGKALVISLFFALKKYRLSGFKYLEFVNLMFDGIRQYKERQDQ